MPLSKCEKCGAESVSKRVGLVLRSAPRKRVYYCYGCAHQAKESGEGNTFHVVKVSRLGPNVKLSRSPFR
jgi:hypothetical protein